MEQKMSVEQARKTAVLAERDSLLLTALLLEVYYNDPAAKDRMATTLNMLASENLRLLNAAREPLEREKLLAAGVASAHQFLKDLPTLHYRLPSGGQRRPTTP